MKNLFNKKERVNRRLSSYCFCLFTLLVVSFSAFSDVWIEDNTSYGWRDPIANSENTPIAERFDTYVSPVLGNVHWKVVDFYLPLSGPDIKIARKLDPSNFEFVSAMPVYTPTEIFDWSLDIPKVHVNFWGDPNKSMISACDLPGVKNVQVSIDDATGFDSIGLNDSIDYPANTVVHFSNNWLLKCQETSTRSNSKNGDGSDISKSIAKIVLVSPEGTTYKFAYAGHSSYYHRFSSTPKASDVRATGTYYVTDIEDKFGNWLTYDYKDSIQAYNDNGTVRTSVLLLTSVRSKGGVEVNLQNDGENITSISYQDTHVVYTPKDTVWSFPPYNLTLLSEVTQGKAPNTETWTYIYNEFGAPTELGTYPKKGLTQIKNPWGGVADFTYKQKTFGCSKSHLEYYPWHGYALQSLSVTGADIAPYSVSYDVWRNIVEGSWSKPTEDFAYTDITYANKKERYKFHCKEWESDNVSDIRDHRIVSIEERDNSGTLIKVTNNVWEEQVLSYEIGFLWHDLNGPNRLKLKTVTIDNDYETSYGDFDLYNNAQSISEINSKHKRYTQKTYQRDPNNWVINLPAITKLSSDNTSFTPVNETTYLNVTKTLAGSMPEQTLWSALLPYEEKSYGVWQKKYTDYHTEGNVKKIEYNQKLAFGDSSKNRYQKLESYKRGLPQVITMPNRFTTGEMSFTRVIDDNGWITAITDLNGNTTNYQYDDLGRIKAIKSPTGATAWLDSVFSWSYNGGTNNNQAIRSVKRCTLNVASGTCNDTATVTATTTYDALLRPASVATTDGANTVYQKSTLNAYNQLVFQSYPSATSAETAGVTYSYDALQRQKTITYSSGGTVTNEFLPGNKIRVTDAGKNTNNEQHATTTTYLAYGSPGYGQATKIESPESVTTELAIDVFGNINSITQSGLNAGAPISQTEYRAYDSQKRLCQIERSDVGTTVISHEVNGDIAWQAQGQTAANHSACNTSAATADKVSFTYDNLGNKHTIRYGDSTPTRTFTYDNNGVVTDINATGFAQHYNYNTLGLLDDETLTIDGKELTLTYGYTPLGHVTSLTYPDGLAPVNFATNAFGQATQAIRTFTDVTSGTEKTDVFVKGSTNKARYYASGSIDTFTYGNDVVHKTRLNNRNMPSQITDTFNSTDRVNLSYLYDNNSNITRISNTRDAGDYNLSEMTYDGLDRLISTTGGTGIGSSAITYDGLGNIRTYSNDSFFNESYLTYNYKTNLQLSHVTTTGTSTKVRDFSAENSYDNRGNVKLNGNTEGLNSFEYNLANQMISAGDNSYVYDGYNRRIKTQDSKGTNYSFYNQAGKLLYRETPKGGINYIFLGDKLVAKEGTGVVASSDSIMNYKPFGDSIEEPKDDVGYTGHKFDTDLGLSYMQARYYDPVIGRFYGNDAVDALSHLNNSEGIQGFNRYSYAVNNPYKYTDPDGKAICAGACIAAVVLVAKVAPKIYKAYKSYKKARTAANAIINKKTKGLRKQIKQHQKKIKNERSLGVKPEMAGRTTKKQQNAQRKNRRNKHKKDIKEWKKQIKEIKREVRKN